MSRQFTRSQEVRVVPANIYDQGTGSSDKDKTIKYLSEKIFELEGNLNVQIQKYDINLAALKAKYSREAKEATDKVRDGLSGDLDNVSIENARLRTQNEGVLSQIKKCKTEKTNLEVSIKSTTDELNKELELKKELEVKLEEKENALKQKEVELEAKKIVVNVYECQEYKNEIKKLKLHINKLTRDIDTKKAEMSSLKLKVVQNNIDFKKQLEKYKEKLNKQLYSIKQSNARLLKLKSELELQLSTCKNESIQKDARIQELQKEKEALQQEKEDLQKAKDACEKEKKDRITNLNIAKLDLEGKLKITQEKLKEKEKADSEIKSLKSQTDFLKKNNTKVKEELLRKEERLREDQQQKEEQIKGIETDIKKIESKYDSKIQSLSLEIDSKEAMILRLKKELQESRANLKKCNSSNANLQREKEKLNKELETCRNQRNIDEEHLKERITNLNTQIVELKSEKQYLEQSRSEFKVKSKDRIGYEKEQLRKLNEAIKLKDKQISDVKEELENLRKDYNEKERQLLSEIERKNSEIEKLEGRLQASEFILKTEREDSQRLLERIKELDLARKDAEEVNKSIENDRIELQRGITSKHVEIQRLERELDSLKRKLTELENNPAADFDAYNQGMEEAKQNYIQQIQELQSRISGFDTEKKRMEIQLEECTKVRLELSSKINDLEKLVGNLKLENEKLKLENENLVKQVKDREAGSVKLNEKLKLENENLVKQVKDREAGSVKLNEKLKVENQKLIKEREMYSSQFQQTQKLQADNTRYEEIVKSLQEKLQSEILKNRGEKSVIENEYRQSLETIEELNKQLETSKKLLSENSSKLLQTQQMQALQSFQSSQASQDKIKELENINNLLREEITKISEQLRLKNSEISREGSSRILEIKNEEERLTGILKRLNTEIGFSEHQLRQLQENISKKKDISVVSSFNLSINDEEYDRIQRIIRNVERVTKKCDKLSVSKMNK
jgi:chromosome segregation ATPase